MRFRLILLLSFFVISFISCQRDPIRYQVNNDTNERIPPTGNTSTGSVTVSDTPCKNGFAGIYPCRGYDLLAHIELSVFDANEGNDSWGWTDSTTGKEYVLMGLDNGTAFVDISDPINPVFLGKLPTSTETSPWRDIKVYDNHAYIVSEAPDHGVQVFDLTQLREVNSPKDFTADRVLKTVPTAHNMVINPQSGYGYVVGTIHNDKYLGGVHFLNLNDPNSIRFEGGYGGGGYCHDAQVVNYSGPDQDYTGREIFIGSNETQLVIVDVTDKENPTSISQTTYQNVTYTHQGWFDKNQRFFLLGDEQDELRVGGNTRTLIFDLRDLDQPILHHTYYGSTNAIDHNGYVNDDLFYLANYTAGIRVIAIDDLEGKNMNEIGFFDTFPPHNAPIFAGAWSVYPFFDSGVIVISDINRGLFLIKKSK